MLTSDRHRQTANTIDRLDGTLHGDDVGVRGRPQLDDRSVSGRGHQWAPSGQIGLYGGNAGHAPYTGRESTGRHIE